MEGNSQSAVLSEFNNGLTASNRSAQYVYQRFEPIASSVESAPACLSLSLSLSLSASVFLCLYFPLLLSISLSHTAFIAKINKCKSDAFELFTFVPYIFQFEMSGERNPEVDGEKYYEIHFPLTMYEPVV